MTDAVGGARDRLAALLRAQEESLKGRTFSDGVDWWEAVAGGLLAQGVTLAAPAGGQT